MIINDTDTAIVNIKNEIDYLTTLANSLRDVGLDSLANKIKASALNLRSALKDVVQIKEAPKAHLLVENGRRERKQKFWDEYFFND